VYWGQYMSLGLLDVEPQWEVFDSRKDGWPPHVDFLVRLVADDNLSPEILEMKDDSEPIWWGDERGNWADALCDSFAPIDVRWQDWALHEGIAPDQEFWVRMTAPVYTQDYWGEWDSDYEVYVTKVEPITEADALSRWVAFYAAGDVTL
jgi:hypothetical protein